MRITFDSSHHTQKKLNKITLYHMLLKQSQLKTTLNGNGVALEHYNMFEPR